MPKLHVTRKISKFLALELETKIDLDQGSKDQNKLVPGSSIRILKFQNLGPDQDREKFENLKIRRYVDPSFRQLNEVSGGAENVFYHDDFSNLLQKISELKVVQFECFDEFKDFCKGKRHLKL